MLINTTLHLHKMDSALDAENMAQYALRSNNEEIVVNDYLSKQIKIQFLSEINCIGCGRKTKKSFNQGYCFVCLRSKAACDSCIIKPELCHYDEGTCREPTWGEAHCLKPHYIYLANTSGLKVGITREKNVPMRWIDQGAVEALPILEVNQRLLSGVIEVALKKHVADKTSWQKMLKGAPEEVDLLSYKEMFLNEVAEILDDITSDYGQNAVSFVDKKPVRIRYPVLSYPQKVKSFNLDKDPLVEGQLLGIKGQYLILDNGVINLRKFAGYRCDLQIL